MGWEKRDKHQYYYRKVRTGQRVVSQYVGNDAQAQERALQEQRAPREQQRHALRQALLEQMKLEDAVADIDHLVSAIVTGAYLAAGYYCHHREWRKVRPPQERVSARGKRAFHVKTIAEG